MSLAQLRKFGCMAALALGAGAPALAVQGLQGGEGPNLERTGQGGCISVVTVSRPVAGLTVTRAQPQGEACRREARPQAPVEVNNDVGVNVTVATPRRVRGGTSRCNLGAPCEDYRFRDSTGAYNLGAPRR